MKNESGEREDHAMGPLQVQGRRHGAACWLERGSVRLALAVSLLSSLGIVGWACGGLTVGSVRERGSVVKAASLKDVRLELLTRFNANDCPSPAWSPDGSRLVYSEQWVGRVMVYDLEKAGSTVVYDSATAPMQLNDVRYNLYEPVFVSDEQVVMGPGWAGELSQQDAWSKGISVSTTAGSPPVLFSAGSKPQACAGNRQVLLEASNGLRLVDESGKELAVYPMMCFARWSPDCSSFAALSYPSYCGEQMDLVLVGEGQKRTLERNVGELAWKDDGSGLAFVRPRGNSTYYSYGYDWGELFFHELGSGSSERIATQVRNPAFVPGRGLLVYETPEGLGLSDLSSTRVLRDLKLRNPRPSPNGEFLVGVTSSYSNYQYYSTASISIYAFSSD
ncbi:MAG: hypothetical protein RBU37_16980 [Myxococcota bacterium]|jgi:hypothetical protein|nr:hypothetical protein [Myxococcota bacterium]